MHVPLERLVDPDHFALCTTELFGPFQVLTTFSDATLPLVLEALEGMTAHLTAAVVSNDARFTNHVLAHSVNGTTYCGRRARTTGAPQNHVRSLRTQSPRTASRRARRDARARRLVKRGRGSLGGEFQRVLSLKTPAIRTLSLSLSLSLSLPSSHREMDIRATDARTRRDERASGLLRKRVSRESASPAKARALRPPKKKVPPA